MNLSQVAHFEEGHVFGRLEGRTLIEVRGGDRIAFLHNLCTNDIKSLQVGHGCEAFFTNVQGKVICHAMIFAHEDAIWISSDPGVSESIVPHLDRYIIREDVALIDRSAETATVALAGATATQIVQREFTGLQHTSCDEISGWPRLERAWLAQVPFSQAAAYFVFVSQENEPTLVAHFRDQGIQETDEATLEWARIQAGFPCSGKDVTIENLPQEVSRNEQAISFTKGCYLGQETVARIDAMGHVNKHLVQLELSGDNLPPNKTALNLDGKTVGYVTSSAISPKAGVVALGYVRREVLEKALEQAGQPDSVRSQLELASEFGSVRLKV